jgi:hypothetical protein
MERKRATFLEGLDSCRPQIESAGGVVGVVVLAASVVRATWWRIVGVPADRMPEH